MSKIKTGNSICESSALSSVKNKLYLHGVFKGRLKFLGFFQTHSHEAMHMHHSAS